MAKFPSRAVVEFNKLEYPGRRIRFLRHLREDPRPLTPGLEGVCWYVDDAAKLLMRWEDGRTLALSPGGDEFKIIPSQPDDDFRHPFYAYSLREAVDLAKQTKGVEIISIDEAVAVISSVAPSMGNWVTGRCALQLLLAAQGKTGVFTS